MFSKLQQDASRIDSGIRSLNSKMASVMTGYTRNNPDADAALERRHTDADQLGHELRQFIAEAEQFAALLAENRSGLADIEHEINAFAEAENLKHCVVPVEKHDAGERKSNEESSETDGRSEMLDDNEDEHLYNQITEEQSPYSDSIENNSPMICIARNRASVRVGEAEATPAIQSRKKKSKSTLKESAIISNAGLFKNVHRNLHF